jgi:phosphonate dehydrogenase
VQARLAAVGELDLHRGPEPLTAGELGERLADADAMMGFMTERVDARLLSRAPRLRIVACALKGCDSYDVAACTAAGVWLSIVPDLLTAPTAELALGLAIGLGRHVRQGDATVRAGRFRGWRPTLYGRGLSGARVAVLGLGAVGCAIIQRLRGFDCQLLGVDPGVPVTPPDVLRCELHEALAQSDFVFVALPLTRSTLRLIDRATLAASRRGALWINVGRGSVVDELAMAEALASGQAGGYAADVFAFEDWSVASRPREVPARLRLQANTLFAPHLGSAVASVRREIEHRAADNILAALNGQRPPDAVNPGAASRLP